MSNQFKKAIQQAKEIKRYCLPQEDWEHMAAALVAAEEMFKAADEISEEEWAEWTADVKEKQGFPAIIYHDMPIIIRPSTSMHKVG